ncbi:hypothetical protein Q5P01_004778 [Channa striata]|uniref:Vesicular inhibitory amino acid transporter n=1 Tax=Channa striata TaxID=64152 RepID=A0AA88SXW0_CHASR|nr:hypothetical protein Q5P01_004778 [Channa striata]
MGSPHWTQNSGQPWSAAGSLWGWAAARLHLDWTARFVQDDEEMLILTHSDELSRTYDEDNRSTSEHVTNRSTSCDHSRRNDGDLTVREKPPQNQMGSTKAPWQDSSSFKETRASLITTGPKTITTTLAVSPSDAYWFRNSGTYDRGGKSLDVEADSAGSNSQENPRAVGHIGMQRLSEDIGKKEAGEGPEDRTSQVCGTTDEDRASVSLANPAQDPQTRFSTITAWEAGWNVTNAIQGIFVLGLPFALVQSGYVGLILLVLSAWVCNHTGRILVACLYEHDPSGGSDCGSKVRVRHSYQDVVEASCKGLWPNWPGLWGWMVNVAQVVELLMTCTLYLVVSTSLLCESLSAMAAPRSLCSLVSLMFLLPCLLLTDLRPVSTLSLLCSLAHILISLLVMLYCLSWASSWSWSSLSLSVNPEDFLVSVGVIIFSYTSQIFLPALEGSMEDRGQFNSMLGWTHSAACIMKTMFSLLAVLTWGAETSEVITDNLPSDLRPVVNLCLLAKALLSYPLPFYSAAEILQSCLFGVSKHGGGGVRRPALLVRAALLVTSYLLALLVPRFSLLMGLTGSVTGAAMTLILPCLFHLRLHRGLLSARERLIDVDGGLEDFPRQLRQMKGGQGGDGRRERVGMVVKTIDGLRRTNAGGTETDREIRSLIQLDSASLWLRNKIILNSFPDDKQRVACRPTHPLRDIFC